MTGARLSAATLGLRFEEKRLDMVRLIFEDEEPRVLRRRSWLGIVFNSSEEVREVAVSGEMVSAVAFLLVEEEEDTGFRVS